VASPVAAPGLKCLYIGHSFFVPISNTLDDLVADAGVIHDYQTVFSGGNSGIPSELWKNEAKRTEAQAILNAGDIELLGMTLDSTKVGESFSTEYYEKWIDYAREQNPDTIFMIGLPWKDFPSDSSTADYTSSVRSFVADTWPGILDALRAKYPGVTIIENPYGLAIVEARLLFEAGGLPDIDGLFGDCKEDVTGEASCGDYLFGDEKGHIGKFARTLTALIWLNRIFNVDLSTYSSPWLSASRTDRLAGITFTTNITAVAKAVLDAYDAGDLCGTTGCYSIPDGPSAPVASPVASPVAAPVAAPTAEEASAAVRDVPGLALVVALVACTMQHMATTHF